MKRREGRIKVALRWGCTAMVALLSLALIHGVIGPHGYTLLTRFSGMSIDFSLSGGSIWAFHTEYHGPGSHMAMQGYPHLPWRWLPWEYQDFINIYGARQRDFRISLWPLWMMAAACSTWFWYLRLRREPGYCRCGYELAGIPTAKCPECGRTISRGAPA